MPNFFILVCGKWFVDLGCREQLSPILKHKNMKSRITIEVDFDNGNPYLKVLNDIESTDVRDKLVSHFRQKLSGISSWCTVRFNDIPSHLNQQIFFEIHPLQPKDLKEQAEIMLEQDRLNKKEHTPN